MIFVNRKPRKISCSTCSTSSKRPSPTITPPKSTHFNTHIARQFVLSEGLKKIQEIKAAPGSKLRQYIDEINSLYPQEIIQYYSAGYEQALLKKLDDYNADG